MQPAGSYSQTKMGRFPRACLAAACLTAAIPWAGSGQAPEQASAKMQQADRLLLEGDPKGAITLYKQAGRLRPESPDIHHRLSQAWGLLGETAKQEQELRRTLELNPDFAPAHNELGQLALAAGRGPEAERYSAWHCSCWLLSYFSTG